MKLLLYIIIYTLLQLFFNNNVTGQDVLYSQTNYHQLFINPAYAGNSSYPRFMAGYRNQWPALGSAYVSYYATYDQYVPDMQSNIGFALSRDVQGGGAINRTSGELVFGYPIELGRYSKLSLGFQVGLVQKNISVKNLALPDQNPYSGISEEVIPARSKIFPDFAAGIAFYIREQYLFGFAVHHMNTPQETNGAGYYFKTPIQINFQAMTEISFSKPRRGIVGVTLIPGIYAQIQQSMNFITWGSNLRYRGFITGLWLRNNLSFSVSTLIVHLGFSTGVLEFVYSYDAWVPGNNQYFKNFGSHEVTFINHFEYNDPRKKMRTIKCPKFSR